MTQEMEPSPGATPRTPEARYRQLQAANDEMVTLVAKLRQRDRVLQLLHRANSLLQACQTQEEAGQVAARVAADLFAGSGGCLAAVRADGRELAVMASWGKIPTSLPVIAPGDCWDLRRGQPHELREASTGLLCAHLSERPDQGSLRVPLAVQGESLGLLCLVGGRAGAGAHGAGWRNAAILLGEAIQRSFHNLRVQARELFAAADRALYAAKFAGRDRLVCSGSMVPPDSLAGTEPGPAATELPGQTDIPQQDSQQARG